MSTQHSQKSLSRKPRSDKCKRKQVNIKQKLMSDENNTITGTAISSSPPYGKDTNLEIMASLQAGHPEAALPS